MPTLDSLQRWHDATDKETSRTEAKRRARALARKLRVKTPRWAALIVAPADDGPDLQPIAHLPWEIESWRRKKDSRQVGMLNGAVALVDGDTVRMYPSLTAACACAGR
jgi:hypothetical protein